MRPLRTLHLPVDADIAVAALLVCPLAACTPNRGLCDPVTVDEAQWKSIDGALLLTAVTRGEPEQRFIARVELPGQVSCEHRDGSGDTIRYHALIQPTETGACTVHVATDMAAAAETRLALNRSLVTLRRRIGRIAGEPAVAEALEAFGQMAQETALA